MEKRITNVNKNLPDSNRALDVSHQDVTLPRTNRRYLEPTAKDSDSQRLM